MIKWKTKKKNREGFTLVELVVVIAILSILASMAVPKLSGFTDTTKRIADEQLNEIIKNIIKLSYVTEEIYVKEGETGSITISNAGNPQEKDKTSLKFEEIKNIVPGNRSITIESYDEVASAIIDKLESDTKYQIKDAKFKFELTSDGEVKVEDKSNE